MPHGVTKQKHLKEIEQYKEADGYVLGFGFLSGTLEDFLPPSPSFHPLLFPALLLQTKRFFSFPSKIR